MLREKAEHTIYESKLSEAKYFIPFTIHPYSNLQRFIGPEDIEPYYTDLSDPLVVTRLALVHQRFPPIHFQHGIWLNPSATCVTMEKSTHLEVITAVCRHAKNF